MPKGRPRKLRSPASGRRVLIVTSTITLLLWFVPFSNFLLYPLRLFVTFVHESGHALAALGTGGHVVSLTIYPNGEGLTATTSPPWAAWLIHSGGYIATSLFGALLLHVGRLRRVQRPGTTALYIMAFAMVGVVGLWARQWDNVFTVLAGLVLALIFGLLAWYTPPRQADFLASFLAIQCILNALGDLRWLIFASLGAPDENDAAAMANDYGLAAWFWALVWAVLSLGILALSLWSYWRATDSRGPR